MKSDGPNPVAFGVKKWPYFAQKKYVEFPTISVSFEKKKKKRQKKVQPPLYYSIDSSMRQM